MRGVSPQMWKQSLEYERERTIEAAEDTLEYTHAAEGKAATTVYADESSNGYEPNKRLLDGRTRGEKYARLWTLNAGLDGHRAEGRTRKDVHKVDESSRDKKMFVDPVSQNVGLSNIKQEKAKSVAASIDGRCYNWCGGLEAIIFGVVEAVADFSPYKEVDWFAREVESRIGVDNLMKASEKIADDNL